MEADGAPFTPLPLSVLRFTVPTIAIEILWFPLGDAY